MNKHKLCQLKSLYAEIPKINCKGLCSDTCGTIAMSRGEFRYLTLITRQRPQVVEGCCNYLKDAKCSIYNHRPSVCRLFGVTEPMRCEHGCEPERMLTEEEARDIMDRISDLFGEPRRSFVDNR